MEGGALHEVAGRTRELATARRAVPHVREFLADTLTPLAAYQRLAASGAVRFLFESVTGGEQVSRYSFLGAGPRALYRLFADRLEEEREDRWRVVPGSPLAALRGIVEGIVAAPGPLPLMGGFVGFFGFDLLRLVERLPNRPPDPFASSGPGGALELPVALLARFDELLVFDHAHQRILAVANEVEGESGAAEAEAALDRIEKLLAAGNGHRTGGLRLPEPLPPPPTAVPSLSGPRFRAAVERAKEYIAAGDIFQVVLARRFEVQQQASPLALYRALRLVNPSPYMVLFEAPEVALIGASPEMLVRKQGNAVVTRPIAGTRPRSDDPEQDQELARALLADPKERAEHVMLVDLGRNDLGRVAAGGSVRVASFLEVERYSHVMHLVSSVEAELAPGRGALDALLACFPAGTVSGAPKLRAVEIIDELEPEARGPYAGAVGYLSYTGDLDTCITIRTLVTRPGPSSRRSVASGGSLTSVSAGAGIVADSDPAAEERETENKAAALLQAVALAGEIEDEA